MAKARKTWREKLENPPKGLPEVVGGPHNCSLTTGILMRIVAEAAEEDLRDGKKLVTPYWRVIKKDGKLNPKFPGGIEAQAAHLKEEGHIILMSEDKKPPQVKDFEKHLQTI